MLNRLLRWINENLNELDPTPWHQAALLGFAFFALLCLCFFGNFVD